MAMYRETKAVFTECFVLCVQAVRHGGGLAMQQLTQIVLTAVWSTSRLLPLLNHFDYNWSAEAFLLYFNLQTSSQFFTC